MSFSTVVLVAAAATVVSADYTNTWWTPSSLIASSTPVASVWAPSSESVWAPSSVSVWAPSSSAVESAWAPSSESVWTPSSSTVESAWAPSPTEAKGNISISTSYTNTVYVTKATTATTTVDCGKGTMIFGNGSAPAFTPSLGLPSNMPTDLPSDWSKSIPQSVLSSVLPPQISATGGIVTTNCANASVTYTFTYTPSGSKPKMTSSIIETPAEPTEPSFPAPPSSGGEVPAHPAPGPHDADASSSSSSKSKPSSGFSTGDDMGSAGSRQEITTFGAIFTLCVVAVVACML
jgi:hypothetical protein